MGTIVLVLLTTAGYIANIQGFKFESFMIWLCTNISWAAINYGRGHNDMFCMFIIYSVFCIYGIITEIKKR